MPRGSSERTTRGLLERKRSTDSVGSGRLRRGWDVGYSLEGRGIFPGRRATPGRGSSIETGARRRYLGNGPRRPSDGVSLQLVDKLFEKRSEGGFLRRAGFLEALALLALEVYGRRLDPRAAFVKLADAIDAAARPEDVHDPVHFRDYVLRTADVERTLHPHRPALRRLFEALGGRVCSRKTWSEFVDALRLEDATNARLCYLWSLEDDAGLGFQDFADALCRLALTSSQAPSLAFLNDPDAEDALLLDPLATVVPPHDRDLSGTHRGPRTPKLERRTLVNQDDAAPVQSSLSRKMSRRVTRDIKFVPLVPVYAARADIFLRRLAATPRLPRGYFSDESWSFRGDTVAATPRVPRG